MVEENKEIFVNLNVEEEPDIGTTEIPSLCMNCHEEGITRLLLTKIPFYKEVIVMSFTCEHCGYRNNELQSGSEINQKGTKIVTKITAPSDLNRRVVKSDYCSVRIEELDFEIPIKSQKGEVTTVEGIIQRCIAGLEQDQPVRRIQHPDAAEQIDKFVESLKALFSVETPFTITIEDITGNCFVENPNAPQKDANTTITHFTRTKEQNHMLGIFTQDEIKDDNEEIENSTDKKEENLLEPIKEGSWPLEELHGEVLQFKIPCPDCQADCETNMKVTKIPHFKEVVIMATICDNCGNRTNEVKPGGGIEDKGVKIEVKIKGKADFSRDVLKSDACDLLIRELDVEVGAGALGGRFTTIEGILAAMKDQLVESSATVFGDSTDSESKLKMDKFLLELDRVLAGERSVTMVLDDPTGNSYVQSLNDDGTPDEALRIIHYHRSHEQNEDLGLNDMKTENYES
uniref:Putative c4-type zn-finger protein n=1 Tax=Corethrella appendiculata TaxID=1370023 RepID=U5EUY5_9DIPT